MSRSTLTDSAVRHAKPGDGDNGIKMSDGGGLYLHVTKAGKYWRLAYRFNDKQKLLALGIYPAVPLAMARERRDQAKSLLAKGIDPSAARREAKRAKAAHEANTFAAVAKKWLAKTAALRNDITQQKVPAARAACPLPSHPALRPAGQRQPKGQPGQSARTLAGSASIRCRGGQWRGQRRLQHRAYCRTCHLHLSALRPGHGHR